MLLALFASALASYEAARALAQGGDWAGAHAALAGETAIAARYLDGVALARLGEPLPAIAAFGAVLDAVDAHAGRRLPPKRVAELERDRELAILGVARVLYGAGEMARAVAWYERVERGSAAWPQAQFEAAWAEFVIDEHLAARTRLAGVRSAGAWHPELPWLEVLVTHALQDPFRYDPCAADRPPPVVTPADMEAAYVGIAAELGTARVLLLAVIRGTAPVESLPPAVRAALRDTRANAPHALLAVDDGLLQAEILRFDVGCILVKPRCF